MDNMLKAAISGSEGANLHVVYTYLIDSKTGGNPFRGHTQSTPVTFIPDTPNFLGIYFPFE